MAIVMATHIKYVSAQNLLNVVPNLANFIHGIIVISVVSPLHNGSTTPLNHSD